MLSKKEHEALSNGKFITQSYYTLSTISHYSVSVPTQPDQGMPNYPPEQSTYSQIKYIFLNFFTISTNHIKC